MIVGRKEEIAELNKLYLSYMRILIICRILAF